LRGDYRYGFKKEAEVLAREVRRAMGLECTQPLDPRSLANHVGVPVFELDDLVAAGMREDSLRHLLGRGRSEFSAALFQRNGTRLIVANPVHSPGRQASNIVHEVSHLLLDHQPSGAVIEAGCRRWNAIMEREADWQAGELLVPRQGALEVARSGVDVRSAAHHYGVSEAMMNWRLNHSGARKQAERERASRR